MVQDKYYGYRDAALFSEFVISSLFTTSSVPSTPSTKTVPTVGAAPPTPPSGSPTQQTPAPLNGMPKEGIDTPPASPESRINKKSTTSSGSGSTGPSNIPPLAEFIAYALYRTRLPSTITHLSLCLLTRLKKMYPLARGTPTSPHRLFLSALMLASKITMDDTYSNKSWAIVAGSVWEVKEVNQMERELFAFLGWNVVVGKEELEGWESKWFAEWDVEKESRKVAAKNASVERKRRRTNSVDVVVEPSQHEVAANNVASSSSAGSSSSRCPSPMAVDEPHVAGSSGMWESRAKGSSRHRRAADAARALLRPSSSSSSSEMTSPTFSTSSSGSSSSSSFPAESPYSSCSKSNPTSPRNVRHASSSSSSLSSMAGGFGSNRTRQHSHSRNPRKLSQSQSLSHTSSPYNSRRLSFPSGTMTGTSSQHVSAISSPVEPHHHHYTLPRNYSSSSTFISSATTSPSFDEMSSSPGAETPVTPQSVGPRTPDHYPNQFYPSSMSMYSKPGQQHHWDPHSPFHHPQSGTTSPSPPSIYRPSSYYAAATAPALKAVQHGMGIWNSYVGVPTHHQNQPHQTHQSHPHHHHHHQGSASQGQVQMNLGMGVQGVPGLDSMGMEAPAGW